ncbi:MAG: RNA polymerase factor sigma-54, partial [Thermoanaerobaculia bacterium]
PLSDSKIMKILNDEGINIARRTVAKYRDELNIPSSTDRKQIF